MKKIFFFFVSMLLIIVSCGKYETMIRLKPLAQIRGVNDTIVDLKMPSEIPPLTLKRDGAVEIQIPGGDHYKLANEEIIDSYSFIRLETTDECLIGEIRKLEMDSSLIFIFDEQNDAAFCFSKSGKFLCRYGHKGRGAEEYVKLFDMCIDKTRKEVCLVDDQGLKLMFYDYSGKLLRTQPKYYYFTRIAVAGDHYLLATERYNTSGSLPIDFHELVVSDRNQVPLYVGFPYSEKTSEFHCATRSPLSTFENKVYSHTLLSDTIWEISDNKCKAGFVLKYPDKKLIFTKDEIQEMSDDLYWKKTENRMYFSGHFLCTKDFLLMNITDKNRVKYLIYSRISGQVKFGCPTEIEFESQSLGNRLLSSFDFVTNENSFIQVNQPYFILDLARSWQKNNRFQPKGKDLELLNSIKKEDNPILMVVKLKKF